MQLNRIELKAISEMTRADGRLFILSIVNVWIMSYFINTVRLNSHMLYINNRPPKSVMLNLKYVHLF